MCTSTSQRRLPEPRLRSFGAEVPDPVPAIAQDPGGERDRNPRDGESDGHEDLNQHTGRDDGEGDPTIDPKKHLDRLVDEMKEGGWIRTALVEDAFRTVERHRFLRGFSR
jgi:hypothetical protein